MTVNAAVTDDFHGGVSCYNEAILVGLIGIAAQCDTVKACLPLSACDRVVAALPSSWSCASPSAASVSFMPNVPAHRTFQSDV